MSNCITETSLIAKRQNLVIGLIFVLCLFVVIAILEQVLPRTSMLFTVLKKGAIYALVAVSMNLLNGFTGLFSLGQAGFMLIGAYTYAIFEKETVADYRYFKTAEVMLTDALYPIFKVSEIILEIGFLKPLI